MHLCTTVLRNKTDPDWRFYFFLIVAYYQEMYIRYLLFDQALQGILSVALLRDAITGEEAKRLVEGLRRRGKHHCMKRDGTVLFTMDFDTALTDLRSAKACALASKFEELTLFDQRRRGSIPF